MKRIKAVWTAQGLPAFPEEEMRQIRAVVKTEYVDLCGSFFLFRYLHRVVNADCTLLGDYAFGIFSAILADLDSVPLNDAFSAWLKADTVEGRTFPEYLDFVKANCGGEEWT